VIAFGTDFGAGELDVPAGLSNVFQIAAGDRWNLVLKNDGTMLAWGDNTFNQTNLAANLGDVKQVAAGIGHGLALAYNPVLNYPVNVPQDLLLIYNTNSADSVFVKDYYLAHRPMVSGANVVGISGAALETSTRIDFTNNIRTPIFNWLAANPTKRPQYWILFLGVPARINAVTNTGVYPPAVDPSIDNSVGYELRTNVLGRKPYVTHINMGASSTNDCIAYITKLEYFGTNYSPGKLLISASSGGYGNTNYYFDDTTFGGSTGPGGLAKDAVIQAGASPASVIYSNYVDTGTLNGHVTMGTNLTGYFSWGWHSTLGAEYANNGTVQWNGNSGWWIIETVESFNGQRFSGQGNFIRWFSETGFGSTNYTNTPVGAVTHVDEPNFAGINKPAVYFGLWQRDRMFATCAWISEGTPRLQVVGDPFVKK